MANELMSLIGAFTGMNTQNTAATPKAAETKESKTAANTLETTEQEKAEKLYKAYQDAARDIVTEFGSNNQVDTTELEKSSLVSGFSAKNKAKLSELLGSMSTADIAMLLRRADGDTNGDVTATERRQYMQKLVGYIEVGKSKQEIAAIQNADFLKNGGKVSDTTKAKWIEQFKKFEIAEADYTPKKEAGKTEKTAEKEKSGLEQWAPLIQAGLQMFGGLGGSNTASTATAVDQTALNAQQAQQMMLLQQAQAQQRLAMIPQLPPPNLGTFTGAVPVGMNPLLAGNNGVPMGLPNGVPMNAQGMPLQAPMMNPNTPMPVAQGLNQAPQGVQVPQTQVPSGFTYKPPTGIPTQNGSAPSSAWTIPNQGTATQATAPSAWNPLPTKAPVVPQVPTRIAQAPPQGGW